MPTSSPDIRLCREYTNQRMIENIWRALRDDRAVFRGGREPFLTEMASVVTKLPMPPARFEDDSPCVVPSEPSAETIENFLKRGDILFAKGSVKRRDAKSIWAKPETLRYIHYFLWRKYPDRAATLDSSSETSHVGRLTPEFEPAAPHLILSDPLRIYPVLGRLNSTGPKYGMIFFVDSGRATESGCYYFDCGDPFVLSKHFPPQGAPRYPETFRTGRATLIGLKAYQHHRGYGPAITRGDHVISIELARTKDAEPTYVSIYIQWFEEFAQAHVGPEKYSESYSARMESDTFSGEIFISTPSSWEAEQIRNICKMSA